MKLVVDTNIVFTGILNSSSRIGKLLIAQRRDMELVSCEFLRHEIYKHRSKLLQLTRLPEQELNELDRLVTRNITFFNEAIISRQTLIEAEILLAGIDINDTPFVALANELGARLWTGDKVLIEGLRRRGVKSVITTAELSALIDI